MNIDWGLIALSFLRAAVIVAVGVAVIVYILSQLAIGDFGVR